MKNQIIVTGGAGFIGSNLIKLLIEKTKYKIISLDNYSTGSKKNHINNKRIIYLKGENRNIFSILGSRKNKIKTIFHFGEFSRIYQSFKHIDKCYYSNMLGTFQVVKFCSNNNIRIIYSASSSKFGNKGKDEHLSPYSWSKSKNIEFIENFNKWYGLKYEILYFYNVYGPGQIKNSEMAAVIGIFETQYLQRKKLTVVRPGTQKRDFTHVRDIVNGCYLAFLKGKNDHYLLGTKKTFTVLEIAKMFKSKIKMLPARPGERLSSFYNTNISFTKLGYKPTINIKDYIKDFIYKNKRR
tara:strand:+ start:1469 stop:2356 length:888 start_codon:yes stop_codon:yes gene_type:complete